METTSTERVKDPVCGMELRKQDAYAMRTVGGRTFLFCSETCRTSFDTDPDRYARAATEEEHHAHP